MDMQAFSHGQLAGQRLVVGFEGTTLTGALKEAISRFKVAGIVLFAGNLDNPSQIRHLCEDAQAFAGKCGQPPLLIAVDQEGGPVARLKAPFTRFPGSPAMAGPTDARHFGRTTAKELGSVGINMNLAPVLDVIPEDGQSVMTERVFGSDPHRAAELGTEVIKALQKNGVMAVAKHFPGIGRTTLDSHFHQPVLETPLSVLSAVDLPPFRAAVGAGVSGIMLSHILYTALDDRWPASLSEKIARDLLRYQLGYGGVVMTDDLDMKSVKGRYPMPDVTERIVAADIDLALICHEGPDIGLAFESLSKQMARSPAARSRGRAAAARVMALKKQYLSAP